MSYGDSSSCGYGTDPLAADAAERWRSKPVSAMNATIWWLALRDNGITEQLYGCGRLLRELEGGRQRGLPQRTRYSPITERAGLEVSTGQ